MGATLIGFIYPILGSFYSILSGTAVEKLVWRSGIEKQGGIFTRIHPFSHAMLIFVFIYSFFIRQLKQNRSFIKYGLAIMLVIAIFCIYKSHVRTVYLGLFIFCTSYLWNFNKRYFYAFVFIVLCVSIFNLPQVEQIFWQSSPKEQKTLDQASSGRITTWQHNLTAYSYYNLTQKIGGIGLGGEGEKIIGGKILVEPSHNDYLTLLMTIGPIGLVLYLLIYLTLLKDIYFSNIPKNNKNWFLSVVISVLIMNFVSNGYIFRVELSQFFWLLMGIFYNQNKDKNMQATEV
jgi:O-antigen ligase